MQLHLRTNAWRGGRSQTLALEQLHMSLPRRAAPGRGRVGCGGEGGGGEEGGKGGGGRRRRREDLSLRSAPAAAITQHYTMEEEEEREEAPTPAPSTCRQH